MSRTKKKQDPFQLGEKKLKTRTKFTNGSVKSWTDEFFMASGDKNSSDSGFLGATINKKRVFFLGFLIILIISGLFLRAGHLQVVKGVYYRNLAEGNRIRLNISQAERGIIYDRNMLPLVENIPNFALTIIPADLPKNKEERKRVLQKTAKLNGLMVEEISTLLRAVPNFSYQPIFIRDNLSYEEAILFNISNVELPGVVLQISARRRYLTEDKIEAQSLSHILGYEGNITKEQLNEHPDYTLRDRIGKTGIEFSYENFLKGVNGIRKVEVDALGREKKVLAETPSTPGQDIILTIDAELQSFAEKTLKKHLELNNKSRGAVIIVSPRNGEIYSAVSLPTFDNNDFSIGIEQKKYQELIENPDKPLFNRAFSGEYPPGSTFKPIVAAAALEEGIINRSTGFLSSGGIRIGNLWWFPDWKAGGHGYTNVTKAIAESVNTFFYTIGGGYRDFQGLGVELITKYARQFGLGSKLGVDIPGEADGFLPDQDWKEQVKGEPWYIGDTYHYAIGQGDLAATPLQVAAWMSVFADGGILYKPHLVKAILGKNGGNAEQIGEKIIKTNIISGNNAEIVRHGLREAVESGSARRLLALPVAAAAKTGTAQWRKDKTPHAWFSAFAPYENPEIVVVVLVEEGESGAGISAAVAYDILSWYFQKS